MTLTELLISKTNDELTYNDLLGCVEWKNKREEILRRDNRNCNLCGIYETGQFYFGDKSISFKMKIKETSDTSDLIDLEYTDVPTHLEVHHKFYMLNRYPWQYEDDALISVCRSCHQDIHDNTIIPIYDENMVKRIDCEVCSKCVGKGYLSEYNHVQNGRCFKCGGSGRNIPFEYKNR